MEKQPIPLKNVSTGPKGIHDASGAYVEIAPGKTATVLITKAEFDDLPEYFEVAGETHAAQDLHEMKIADLKEIARVEDIDIGDATRKDDIIAAIELGREAAAA